MKRIILTLIACAPLLARAESAEEEVRRLDRQEAEAVLRGDYATLDRLWDPDFTVNTPQNDVTKGTRGRVRKGQIAYSSFVREVEMVVVRGDTVILMGREMVVPTQPRKDAGQTIHRRFTNIWMRSGGTWRLAARHANVIAAGVVAP